MRNINNTQNPSKAVIFDMDGVLFDTERLIYKTWCQVAQRYKLDQMDRVRRKCIARNHEEAKAIFHSFYGEDINFEEFKAETKQLFNEEIEKHGIPIKSGVTLLLSYLKKENYKLAIASSTKKAVILSYLERTGLSSYFEVIVGGDMVVKGKPHPEIYQKACSLLCVNPQETYCIEDSLSGVQAGKGAGLKVMMVPDLVEPSAKDLLLVHKCYTSLLEVKDYFETLAKNEVS